VLLAGANNSGKTALLSALDLVVRGAVPTTPRHAAAVEPARVRARFVLSEEEQNQLLKASGLTGKARTEALRWIEWHFIEAPENALQALELHASWPDRDTVLIAQVVFIPPSSHRLLRNRGVLVTLSGSAPSGGSGSDPLRDFETVSEGGGVPDLISNLPSLLPPLEPIVQFLNSWRQRYYHFSA
jgi:hypothetical protein